jgi:hypothetical protein
MRFIPVVPDFSAGKIVRVEATISYLRCLIEINCLLYTLCSTATTTLPGLSGSEATQRTGPVK